LTRIGCWCDATDECRAYSRRIREEDSARWAASNPTANHLAAVEHVEVLRIRPGDTLIVRIPHRISRDVADAIKANVASQLPFAVPILVLADNITLSIARPEETP